MLLEAGFKDVINMSGGIDTYHGIMASGPPETGAFCFPDNLSPTQLLAVLWTVSEGTMMFYYALKGMDIQDDGVVHKLLINEQSKQARIKSLSTDIAGAEITDFPAIYLKHPGLDC